MTYYRTPALVHSLEATGCLRMPYGGTRLGVVDPSDPFGRVQWIHPDRLTEDMRGTIVRCNCASVAPTLGAERAEHLASCPFSVLVGGLP